MKKVFSALGEWVEDDVGCFREGGGDERGGGGGEILYNIEREGRNEVSDTGPERRMA